MANRFETRYKLPGSLYTEGAPIIILDGALLYDTATGMAVTQLKYANVSDKNIKGLKIGLHCFDMSKSSLEGVDEYQYVDINIFPGQEFGDNNAIVLPNHVSQLFSITSIEVVFLDDSVWTLPKGENLKILPAKTTLADGLESNELVQEYKAQVSNIAAYVPAKVLDLWSCSCGRWNKGDTCSRCHQTKEHVFNSYNKETLAESYQNKQEEAAKKAAEKKEQTLKTLKVVKKLAIIAAIVFVVVFAGVKLTTNIIIPNINYNKACDSLETAKKSDYASIIKEFEELGDFKDSEKKLQEAKYGYIQTHLDRNDKNTYKYLVNLSSQNYKDCDKIRKDLYPVEIEVALNTSSSPSDNKTKTSFNINKNNSIYLHVKTLGEPGRNFDVEVTGKEKYKYSFSDNSYSYSIDESFSSKSDGKWQAFYLESAYGSEYSLTVTVKIDDYKKTFTIKGNK